MLHSNMKIVNFIRNFFQENKKGLIISSIILFVGALIISSSQNTSFDYQAFLLYFPIYYSFFLLVSISFGGTFNK